MVSCRLRMILKVSMIVTLICSLLIVAAGLLLYFYLNLMMEEYLDSLASELNFTRYIIHSQESLVPSQDYLPEDLDLGDWPQITAMFLGGFGSGLVLYSVFGLIASTSWKTDCLLVLVVVMAANVIFQFLLFGCVTDLDCRINTEMKARLIASLHERYQIGARTNSTFTFLMNSVMLMGQCCGVDGPADFLRMGTLNFTYSMEDKDYYVPVLFPLACCKKSYIDKGFRDTLRCAASRELSAINNVGCYENVYEYVHDNYGVYFAVAFVILIFWEVLQIFAGLAILFAPPRVETDAVNQVLIAAEMDDLNEYDFNISDCRKDDQPKLWKSIFVPFAAPTLSEVKINTTSQIW